MNGCATVAGFDPAGAQETLNRWIAHETARAARGVTEAIETYRFNDAAAVAYRFVWNLYCDWYLELAKPVLLAPDGPAKVETRAMVAWARDEILKLLHPFMPFITEELWAVTAQAGQRRDKLLALTNWPDMAKLETLKGPDEPNMEVVVHIVAEVRSIRTTFHVPANEKLSIQLREFNVANTQVLDANIQNIARMANTTVLDSAHSTGALVVRTPVKEGVVIISMPPSFDVNAERARLTKELAKADADIARVDAKLGNSDFLARAPEEVVEGEREKREEALARRTKLAEALERMKGLDV
jgi:valyl-tRNA synthetase